MLGPFGRKRHEGIAGYGPRLPGPNQSRVWLTCSSWQRRAKCQSTMSAAPGRGPRMHGDQLKVKESMTLNMERSWWKYGGAKAAAIRHVFSESPTTYYTRLNGL